MVDLMKGWAYLHPHELENVILARLISISQDFLL